VHFCAVARSFSDTCEYSIEERLQGAHQLGHSHLIKYISRAMSGIEIAGLVLGALPVAIQALEAYRSTLSSMRSRSVTRDLEFMIRDLGTEQQILQNTCETLLQGIVPDSLIDAMIDDPFGPDWKTFGDRLRLRLWRSYGQFQLKVTEMQVAVQELQEKLSVQADGTVRFNEARWSYLLKDISRYCVQLTAWLDETPGPTLDPGRAKAQHLFHTEEEGL
jgi:hypothetical protein